MFIKGFILQRSLISFPLPLTLGFPTSFLHSPLTNLSPHKETSLREILQWQEPGLLWPLCCGLRQQQDELCSLPVEEPVGSGAGQVALAVAASSTRVATRASPSA